MVDDVDVARLQFSSPPEVRFFFTGHAQLPIAECPIIVGLVVLIVEFDGLGVISCCLLVPFEFSIGKSPVIEEIGFTGVQLDCLAEVLHCFFAQVLPIEADAAIVIAECVMWFEGQCFCVVADGLINLTDFVVSKTSVEVGFEVLWVLFKSFSIEFDG